MTLIIINPDIMIIESKGYIKILMCEIKDGLTNQVVRLSREKSSHYLKQDETIHHNSELKYSVMTDFSTVKVQVITIELHKNLTKCPKICYMRIAPGCK